MTLQIRAKFLGLLLTIKWKLLLNVVRQAEQALRRCSSEAPTKKFVRLPWRRPISSLAPCRVSAEICYSSCRSNSKNGSCSPATAGAKFDSNSITRRVSEGRSFGLACPDTERPQPPVLITTRAFNLPY